MLRFASQSFPTHFIDVSFLRPARLSMTDQNPTLERLDDQINWYDKKSLFNQSWYKRLKIVQILTASAIPLAAGLNAHSALTGG
jgi:hypothetical protein